MQNTVDRLFFASHRSLSAAAAPRGPRLTLPLPQAASKGKNNTMLLRLALTIALLLPLAAADCGDGGSTTFTTVADFNAAVAGCTTWTGSLTMLFDTADAVPLAASLQHVTSQVYMQGAGFPSDNVGDIFPALETAGTLKIDDEVPATSVSMLFVTALGCLEIDARQGSPIEYIYFPNLASIGGLAGGCSSDQLRIYSDGLALYEINFPLVRFAGGFADDKATIYVSYPASVTMIDFGSQGVGPLSVHSINIVNAAILNDLRLPSEIHTTDFWVSSHLLVDLPVSFVGDQLTRFIFTGQLYSPAEMITLDDLTIDCTKCLTHLNLEHMSEVPNLAPFHGKLADTMDEVRLVALKSVSDLNALFVSLTSIGKLQLDQFLEQESFEFPMLEEVTQSGHRFSILCSEPCTLATSLSAPNLHTAAGGIYLRRMPNLVDINIGKSAASLTMSTLEIFDDVGPPNPNFNDYFPAAVSIDSIYFSWVTSSTFSLRSDVPLGVTVERSDLTVFSVSAPSYTSLYLFDNQNLISVNFANADGSLDAASVGSTNNRDLCCNDIQSLSSLWTSGGDTSMCTEVCNTCPTGFVGPACDRCECADSCTGDGTRTGSPTACECVASADNNVVPDCSSSTKVEDDVTLASVAFSGGVQLVTYLDTEDAAFPECSTDGLLAYTRTCHKLHVCMDSTWMELADRPIWAA